MVNLKNNSKKVWQYFEKKFLLGDLGLSQAICISSLKATNIKPFSILVVAPSGQMKSSVSEDMEKIFEEHTIIIPSRFTPYGISNCNLALDNRTWMINDMVRTFDGLAHTKLAELVGFLAELMSEGIADSSTAKSSKIEARMNLLANIPLKKYREVAEKFISSTMAERFIQFPFMKKRKDIRAKANKSMKVDFSIDLMDPCKFEIPKSYTKKIFELSNELTKVGQYELESLRVDEIVRSLIAGHGILNGRTKATIEDFKVIKYLLPNFRRSV